MPDIDFNWVISLLCGLNGEFARLRILPAKCAIGQTRQDGRERAGDQQTKAARLLDISERSPWYKLKKYRLY